MRHLSTYNPGNITSREYSLGKLFGTFFIDFLSAKEFKKKGNQDTTVKFPTWNQTLPFSFSAYCVCE